MSKSCRIGYRPASDRLYSQTHAVSMFSSESSAPASIANAPLALSESARMAGSPAITDFRLDNGLSVVVIPDRRAPVVTHMVW
jgi:zinc protease